MFTELHAMAKAAMLLITATAEGDQLRISISPTYPDGKIPASGAALRPLSLVGTPNELDADFAAVLNLWQAPKRSVLEQAQAQVDEQADEVNTANSSGKVAKASDTKPKAKAGRKSAAAAAPQADTTTQPTDAAETAARAGGEDTSGAAAPDTSTDVPIAAEPVVAVADVYTIDLF